MVADCPATNDVPDCADRSRARATFGEKAMIKRTVGIDLAIRGDQVAQIFDDGKPVGKPIRFRLTAESLTRFVQKVTADLPPGATIQALILNPAVGRLP